MKLGFLTSAQESGAVIVLDYRVKYLLLVVTFLGTRFSLDDNQIPDRWIRKFGN